MEPDYDKAIEMIECAKINLNNIRKMGAVMIPVVEMQLNSALHYIAPGEFDEPEE